MREAEWLNSDRARAYLVILASFSALVAAVYAALSYGGVDPLGKALGTDFASFWTASQLALQHRPEGAWRLDVHAAAQAARFGAGAGYAAFFYPPPFLLACLPLALLAYPVSLLVWLLTTGAAYVAMVRAWLGRRFGWLPILAFPAVLVNAGHGQNGFLTAALLGGALLCGRSRPWLCGVLIGALIVKPHLAILTPVFLLFDRNGRGFLAAAATVVGLCLLSWLVFGTEAWTQFLHTSPIARQALEQDLVGYAKMQSIFAGARLMGAPLALAWGLQALAAVGAVAALWRMRDTGTALFGASLVCATLLSTPFLLDYDLTLLAIPLAVLLRAAQDGGFRPWERATLALAFCLPVLARTVGSLTHLPLTPFVATALLGFLMARARTTAPAPLITPTLEFA